MLLIPHDRSHSDHAATGMGAVVPQSESADHIALIRWDLANTALEYNLRCVEHMIRRAKSCEEWLCVSYDFLTASRRVTHSAHDTHPASLAAGYLAANDVDSALARLALSCEMTVEEWITTTRKEMADARR